MKRDVDILICLSTPVPATDRVQIIELCVRLVKAEDQNRWLLKMLEELPEMLESLAPYECDGCQSIIDHIAEVIRRCERRRSVSERRNDW